MSCSGEEGTVTYIHVPCTEIAALFQLRRRTANTPTGWHVNDTPQGRMNRRISCPGSNFHGAFARYTPWHAGCFFPPASQRQREIEQETDAHRRAAMKPLSMFDWYRV